MPEFLGNCVEPGWTEAHMVHRPRTVGPGYRILYYAETDTWRFEHLCDRGDRGIVTCAPALRTGPGDGPRHVIASLSPLTIEPSILCPDCGTHGFVRNDRWIPA